MTTSLHIQTLYKKSHSLSESSGLNVFLKYENTQPSGSFKLRGIGHLCKQSVENGCKELVCSSGGNAGMAAAYAAEKLNVPITIFLPTTTPQFIIKRLENYGAKTVVVGSVWDETDAAARSFASDRKCVYVPPFDHPLIFDGNSTIIDELDEKPDLVICSVGGGGLLTGIIQGLQRRDWNDVKVISVETVGADSLYQSLKMNERIKLKEITSIAKSLGAKSVGVTTFKTASEFGVIPLQVDDRDAVVALNNFLDEERMLVEPACSCCFVPLYNGDINKIIAENKLINIKNIVVIVCGGSTINCELLNKWKTDLKLE